MRAQQCFGVVILGLVALALLLSGTGRAAADVVFSQTFDNPTGPNQQVVYRVDPFYRATGAVPSGGDANGNPNVNGFITTTSAKPNIFGGFFTGAFGIPNDLSGKGFFLFTGTLNTAQFPSGPPGGEVFGTLTPVPVVPNSNYTFSFWLTNADAINVAQIEPLVNGVDLLGPNGFVSATGFFGDGIAGDQWQQFSFNFNSGSATSVDLSLRNLQTNTSGNDFGLDNITLIGPSAIPEPSSLALLGLGGLALAGWRRWKRCRTTA